jgi:hypothetical protein
VNDLPRFEIVKLLQDPSILRYLEVVGHVVTARQVLLVLDGLVVVILLPLVVALLLEVVVIIALGVAVIVALGVVLVVVLGVVVVLVVVVVVLGVLVGLVVDGGGGPLGGCRRLISPSSLVDELFVLKKKIYNFNNFV